MDLSYVLFHLEDLATNKVHSTHCVEMKYNVNFLGGIGSNGFHIKWMLGTQTIEKIKILGAILELPAKQGCQFGPFTKKSGKIGWIDSDV